MKHIMLIVGLCSTVFVGHDARAREHALGTPHIVFCDAFLAKISEKMPMRYSDFMKFTDGEGMPIAANKRRWDGENNSFLSVDLHSDFVKGGVVTCPNGESKPFGVWDAPVDQEVSRE